MGSKPDGYGLDRSYQQSARMNLQSRIWQELLGFNLHPVITKALQIAPSPSSAALPATAPDSTPAPPRIRIADVGTGTGVWLFELAQALGPDAPVQLDGFDLSPAQFPHPAVWPPNVKLHVADATDSEPPKETLGVYDVVHVRLMVAVIENGDPGDFLRHCAKMLKPGGFLQWEDHDVTNFKVSWQPSVEPFPTPDLEAFCAHLHHMKQAEWIRVLGSHFKRVGYKVHADEYHCEKTSQRVMLMQNLLMVGDGAVGRLRERGEAARADAVDRNIAGAYEEVRKGAYVRHDIQLVVGQKLE